MAATKRALTPTPGSLHSHSHTPEVSPATQQRAQPVNPSPSAASALLRSQQSPAPAPGSHLKSHIPQTLSPEPLTGAVAMADERRLREQHALEEARRKTPNPANDVKNMLAAPQAAMSRARDGPPAPTAMAVDAPATTARIQIPDAVATDSHLEASPTSMSSLSSADARKATTATATEAATTAPVSVDKAIAAETGLQQAANVAMAQASETETPSSNRAMTFPAPASIIEQERRATPSRGMSLPNAGYNHGSPRSPSTKRHKCPFCDTDFTRHHNLKSHLLTHSQEKPYECPTCQARFRRLHDLKRHTKLHTGERPHTCPKCGRRFARGDALARHNKGPGGCAGRRSSFGMDDDESRAGEEVMEGVVYNGDGADDDKMDEDGPPTGPEGRRVSEPAHKASRSRQNSTQGTYHQYSSTYPPLQGRAPPNSNSNRSLFPPPAAGSSSSRDHSSNTTMSPKPSISSIHFGAAQSGVFSHGGMTESPKPLSPGQTESGILHHAAHQAQRASPQSHPPPHPTQSRLGFPTDASPASSISRNRSPSGASATQQPLHSQPFNRGSSSSLHPQPHHTHPPQLPQLPGLAPAPPASMHVGKPTGLVPQQGSASSSSTTGPGSGGGSGGSFRDVMGGSRAGSEAADLWAYVRELESRIARMAEEHEGRIGELQEEIVGLRREVATGKGGQ